jgi:hypothetical protein
MYDDMLSSGRFLKYNRTSDGFIDAPKEEVLRKISQAIQYQKRTRVGEKRVLSKTRLTGRNGDVGTKRKETDKPIDSFSSVRADSFNRQSQNDTRICSDDESNDSAENLDLSRNMFRYQGSLPVAENLEKYCDSHSAKQQSLPLDVDKLVSDAIDAVLGKRYA